MFYALNKYGHTGAFRKLKDIPADATRIRPGEAGRFDALNLSRALADTANRWERWADMDIARRFMRLRYDYGEGLERCGCSVEPPDIAGRLAQYKRRRFERNVLKLTQDVRVSLGNAASMAIVKQWRDRSKYQARHGFSAGQEVWLSIVATPDELSMGKVDVQGKTIRVGNVLAKKTGRGRDCWTITELHPLMAAILSVLESKHDADVRQTQPLCCCV